MFLENDYAEPLFSLHGGSAKAFICKTCKRVTATEGGMLSHLRSVHKFKEQECLYSITNRMNENLSPERHLRLFTPENIQVTTKRSLTIVTEQVLDQPVEPLLLTEPEANDKQLPKPTKEEK